MEAQQYSKEVRRVIGLDMKSTIGEEVKINTRGLVQIPPTQRFKNSFDAEMEQNGLGKRREAP